MSSLNIRPAAERFPHLLHFFDLFGHPVSSNEVAEALHGSDKDVLKSLYEKSLSFLEDKAAGLDFRDDLLLLQKDLYRELEDLYCLDPADSRHHFFVVVPVADRPSMLRDCVESLMAQCEDFGYGGTAVDGGGKRFFRKVSLFVIDDSADEANRIRTKKTATEATRRGMRTRYIGVEEQGALLRHIGELAGGASARLTGDAKDGAFHKGASVTRNLACLFLSSFLRRFSECGNALIYFIDSDEEFGVKVRKGGLAKDIRFINYFYWLDRIFSATDIQVLTGKVVGDPPVSPSVMINTFLDDVMLFLEMVSRLRPDDACPFHRDKRQGTFSAGYHDMVELFGYERPGASDYDCPLPGEHTVEESFRAFSRKMPDFFYGLHPTRLQFYHHLDSFTKTDSARTVYTGNYVFTPEALKYFIPFADLKLRMAGPTLGRILRSRIGDRFASANIPLLHRRTRPDSSRVYRSGVSGTETLIDLSDEFIRQFWGDVMLFSVESLAGSGFPRRRPDPSEISSVVKSVQNDMWRLYKEQKAAAVAKATAVKERLRNVDSWWNRRGDVQDAVEGIEFLSFIVQGNFGEDSRGMRSLSAQIDEGGYAERLSQAIHCFYEDESLWYELIGTDFTV